MMDIEETPLLQMKNVVKEFPGVKALKGVDLKVYSGEIHGLLGENGAGKTTLMNILYGIYKPDSGEILFEGKKVKIASPQDSLKLGIGMVPQHFKLINSHTVLENIALGVKSLGYTLNLKKLKKKVLEICDKYGIRLDINSKVWQLTTGEKQYVELLKVLVRNVKLLILDEPTTFLTPQETGKLFSILKSMKNEGKAIIFITHKLREAKEQCDKITVLRKGEVVGVFEPTRVSEDELAKLMVGESIQELKKVRVRGEREEVVLKVENLTVLNDKGLPAVKNVSLTVKPGEILGIAGVTGSGQEELAESIAGLRRPVNGRVYIEGLDVTRESPRRIFELGVAYIPGDRTRVGILPDLTIWENLILRHHRYPPIGKNGLLIDVEKAKSIAWKLVEEFNIILTDLRAPARTLSGGNMQRLILARELSEFYDRKLKLIIAVHPTRGLDVKAANFIRGVLLKQRERRVGVLLVSEDLEEVLELSDRIAVMYNGEIVGVVPAEKAVLREIGLMMGGALKGNS